MIKKTVLIFSILFCFIYRAYAVEILVINNFETNITGTWTNISWLDEGGSINISIESNENMAFSGAKYLKLTYEVKYIANFSEWYYAGARFEFSTQQDFSDYSFVRFYMKSEITNTGYLNVGFFDDDNNTLDLTWDKYDNDDFLVWENQGDEINRNFWVPYILPLRQSFFLIGNYTTTNGQKIYNGDGKPEFNEIESIEFYFNKPGIGCSGVCYIDDIVLLKDYQPVESLDRTESDENIMITDFKPVFSLADNEYSFSIEIKELSDISIQILDFAGTPVYKETLFNFSGIKNFQWAGKSNSKKIEPGIYFIHIQASGTDIEKKNNYD